MYKRKAIALMITLYFIMIMTVAVGIGLAQSSQATKEVEYHHFTLQTRVVLEDIISILQNSSELNLIVKEESIDSFKLLLSEAGIIQFESSGVNVVVRLSSARSKFNINSLLNVDDTKNVYRINTLSSYLSNYGVNSEYVDILLDNMGKIKEDMSYNSGIFDERPYLFRDYIVSKSHLDVINNFYISTYSENSLNNVDFEKLFYFSKDRMMRIDLNYATVETWRLLLNCDEIRASQLTLGEGNYKSLVDLDLNDEEKIALNGFEISYFEPLLNVNIEINSGSHVANINFEYDIKSKKGRDFVYEI